MKNHLHLSMNNISSKLSSYRKPFSLAVTTIALALLWSAPAEGTIIYRQNFGYEGATPGTGASRVNVTSVGWKGLYQRTNNGTKGKIATSPLDGYYSGVRDLTGRPTNEGNIGTPAPSASDIYGVFALYRGDGQDHQTLAYADHFSIDLSEWKIDEITWYGAASNINVDNHLRAALQIDGQWYVSQSVASAVLASNNLASFSTSAQLRGVTPEGSLWYALSATIGEDFVIGGTALTLPTTGIVNAFGMYATTMATAGHVSMFDSFTLHATAIPEPSSIVLLTAGAIFSAAILRKKRNQTVLVG